MAAETPLEKKFMPGMFPETPAANDLQGFHVSPLPATEGAGNPISLAPGEKVPEPSTFTNNTLTSQVRDDPDFTSAREETIPEAEEQRLPKESDLLGSKDETEAFGVCSIPIHRPEGGL